VLKIYILLEVKSLKPTIYNNLIMNLLKQKPLLFLLGFLFISTLVFAQRGGVLKVYTIPQEAIIKIDSSKYISGDAIDLKSGSYEVKIWAPTRKLVTKTVVIGEGFYKTLSVKLPASKEFNVYRRKLHYYNASRFGLRFGPMLVYGIMSGSKLIQNSNYNKDADRYEKAANTSSRLYETSFWSADIAENKANFYANKEKYSDAVEKINKNNKFILYGAGATVVVNFITWKLSNKLKRPEFKEDAKLARLDIIPTFSANTTGVYFRYQF
jgi:hypothetical protein